MQVRAVARAAARRLLSSSAAVAAIPRLPLGSYRATALTFERLRTVSAPIRHGTRSIFIKVDSTPNPDSMKFSPEDKIVLPESFGTGMHFKTMEDAAGCKLAKRLLKYKEITSVFLGRDFISVNKKEEVTWAPLRPIVLDAIMDAYSEAETRGGSLVEAVGGGSGAASSDTAVLEDDDEVVAMIKELLETRIRPAVQEDGGDIFYVGFDPESGIVKVKMAGSCVGCPSSTATLRNGVENMLTHYIPEVKGIEQVKDEVEEAGERELEEMEARLGVTEPEKKEAEKKEADKE